MNDNMSRTITPNPPADFTPSMGNYQTLRPFRYWCQKVLPLVYDDSLSYYELLGKVIDYLNKTMMDVETLHGDVTSLHTAYEQLQAYVNNYFSSLDVQEEINKKLDSMVKDGTFTKIFGGIVVLQNTIPKSRFVHTEKVLDSKLPSGHIAQGFCEHKPYFYMFHHTDDSSSGYLMKINETTGEVIYDKPIYVDLNNSTVYTGHGNSVNILNNKLYVTGNIGGGKEVYVYNEADASYVKTINTGGGISAFAPVMNDETGIYSAYANMTDSFSVRVWRGYNSTVQNNSILHLPSFQTVRQGLLASNTFIYIPSSYSKSVSYNMIGVYATDGSFLINIQLDDYNDKEMEDLGRTSGTEVLYWNDSEGNVYSIDTTDILYHSGITYNENIYYANNPILIASNGNADDITFTNIGSYRAMIKFKPSVNYNRLKYPLIVGCARCERNNVPITLNPFSGTLSFTSWHINTANKIETMVEGTYILDDDGYYNLSVRGYSFDNTSNTKTIFDSLSSFTNLATDNIEIYSLWGLPVTAPGFTQITL